MTCNSIWSVAQLDEIPTTRIKIPSFSWLTEESQCSVKWSEKSSHRCKPLVDLLKRVIKVNHTALPTLFKCNRGEIVKKQQHGTWMHTKVTHYSVCCRDCPTKLDQREKKNTLYTEPTKCIRPSIPANRYGNNANKPPWWTVTSIVYKRDGRCISPSNVNLIESDENH